MKIKRQRAAQKGKIEIIPMIDVMFFLLATFIMASIALQKYQGINVDLTKGQAENIIANDENITISITHDNAIYINKNAVALEEIVDFLAKKSTKNKENIIIASDRNAKQGVFTEVMMAAKKAGVKKFSIIVSNQ